MLSLISIPFNLLMNILTIINSVILLAILYGVYYIYSNRGQVYDIITQAISKIIEIINLPYKQREEKIKRILSKINE